MGRMLSTKALQPSRQSLQPSVPPVVRPYSTLGPLQTANVEPREIDEKQSALRRITFYAGLGLLFLRLGVIPELIYSFVGVNTYLLYLFAPLAILGAFATGSLQRTFQFRAGWLWLGFFGWMLIATPMSYWIGGSLQRVLSYGRVDFVFLVIVGGLAMNWADVRAIFYTVATAAVVNVATARLLGISDTGGRTNLGDMVGSIGNSNDLASHLLLVLPFAWFVTMDRNRNKVIRLFFLGVMAVGVVVILGTGSRGALVGIGLAMLFVLACASAMQRTVVFASLGLMAVAAPFVLPEATVARLTSLFGEKHQEAEESSRSREYLFNKSVEFTFQSPLFGVGPDQFANYEGNQRIDAGLIGNWHAAHCAWTQVSSECGIPAFLLFVGGLGTSMAMVWRTHRRAKKQGFLEIKNATFCYMTAMIAHLGAITFLSNAYEYYLPAMVGLAISMTFAANRFMEQHAKGNAGVSGMVLATR